jgi:hypothetical protein
MGESDGTARPLNGWGLSNLSFSGAPKFRDQSVGVRHRDGERQGVTALQRRRLGAEGHPPSRRTIKSLRARRRREKVRADLARRPWLWIERFPATLLLAVQYGAFVVRPALQHHTQPEDLILKICFVGILVAFLIEALVVWIGPGRQRPVKVTPQGATVVFAVGVAATLGSALFGTGSYAVQIGSASASPLASLFTPFTSWMLIGVLLFLYLFRRGLVTKSKAGWFLAIAAAVELIVSLRQGFLFPLISFALPVVFAMLLARMIRLRWIVVLAIAVPFVLPPLYNLRNEHRVNLGARSGQEGAASIGDRLRLDVAMSQIKLLPTVPASVGQPNVPTLLRFGLLPRVLDPHRPSLLTAQDLSVALHGTSTNSASLTALGEAYAFNSWSGVIAMVGALTVAVAVAVRYRSPWGFVLLGLLIASLSIFATYPDVLATTLQGIESMIFAMIVCWLVRKFPRAQINGAP